MLTRGEILVAAIAISLTLAVVAIAQSQKTAAKSAVLDWNQIEVKATRTGSKREFFKQPTATLDQLEFHATTVNPGEAAHAPHQHPEEELIIVKDGTIEATQNGNAKRVGSGSVIFQAANELHGLRNVGDKPATYYVIKWFSPGALKTGK